VKKSPVKNTVGAALRALRQQASMGIKSVAPRANVDYTYLSKIENGHKIPSQELIEKLCSIYDVSPDDIVSRLGLLPPDIQEIVQTRGKEVFELLRERYSRKHI
jgi:transcriptional regulator with XRE-family HTH domain